MKYSFLTACGFILLIILLACGVFSLCLTLFELWGGGSDLLQIFLQSLVLLCGVPLAFLLLAGWWTLSCDGRMLSPLTAFIAALIVPVLAGGLWSFGALFGGVMPRHILAWGLPLGFSLFAGWLIPHRYALPAAWLRRYVPLLLLPPLLCLIVLSFYPVFVDPELESRLQTWLPRAAGAWALFALGFLSGTRKAAPALERRRGLAVAAGLVTLAALIVGVNLYVAARNTLHSVPDTPKREIDRRDYEPGRSFENRLVRPVRPPSLWIPGDSPRPGGRYTPAISEWLRRDVIAHFQFETLCFSNHTACRFAEKARFFRSLRAGRRRAAASSFTFFKVETLWTWRSWICLRQNGCPHRKRHWES